MEPNAPERQGEKLVKTDSETDSSPPHSPFRAMTVLIRLVSSSPSSHLSHSLFVCLSISLFPSLCLFSNAILILVPFDVGRLRQKMGEQKRGSCRERGERSSMRTEGKGKRDPRKQSLFLGPILIGFGRQDRDCGN
jgi:hypothetical protein